MKKILTTIIICLIAGTGISYANSNNDLPEFHFGDKDNNIELRSAEDDWGIPSSNGEGIGQMSPIGSALPFLLMCSLVYGIVKKKKGGR